MTTSVYGEQAAILPLVMKYLADRIDGINSRRREETGEGLYEHFIYRVKTEESMREKCRRKGLPETPESALRTIRDSIGMRIVTTFVDDVYRTAEAIEALDGVTVVKRKDYIKNAKPNGYRSYHMIIEAEAPFEDLYGNLPGRFFVEIQLRTIAMDSWAALEHQMSYKRDIPGEELIRAELKRCADELAACDISMQTIRELIKG